MTVFWLNARYIWVSLRAGEDKEWERMEDASLRVWRGVISVLLRLHLGACLLIHHPSFPGALLEYNRLDSINPTLDKFF